MLGSNQAVNRVPPGENGLRNVRVAADSGVATCGAAQRRAQCETRFGFRSRSACRPREGNAARRDGALVTALWVLERRGRRGRVVCVFLCVCVMRGEGGDDGNETCVVAQILTKVWRQMQKDLPLWLKHFLQANRKVVSFTR